MLMSVMLAFLHKAINTVQIRLEETLIRKFRLSENLVVTFLVTNEMKFS